MKKIKIVTDSSVVLEDGVAEKLDISIVPLSTMIDGTIYQDDKLSGEEFMALMAQAQALPKTSQPPIGLFLEVFDQYPKEEYDVISIHISHALSGTPDAARQASNMSKADVAIVDSGFVDQALGFQVIKAAQMAQEGKSREEILETIKNISDNTKVYVALSTLDNLVKGGRIGRTKGLISSFLNVKVVLEMTQEGNLEPRAKGRGAKTFTKWFNELKETLAKTPNLAGIAISHASSKELAEQMYQQLKEMFPTINIPVLHTASVIATHTGPGAFAIEYYTA